MNNDLNKNEKIKLIISTIFIIGYFTVTYMFLTGKVIISQVVQILNYWIGSSNGSAIKTGLINKK